MTNRPRAIGTYAETAVTRTARLYGFPQADRHALHGSKDTGDVGLCPGVIIEVKGGDHARYASDLDIQRWLFETEQERVHAHAAVAFLVVQRRGVGAANAARWWAYWRLGWLADIGGQDWPGGRLTTVRTTFGDTLTLLRAAGYGDPLEAL